MKYNVDILIRFREVEAADKMQAFHRAFDTLMGAEGSEHASPLSGEYNADDLWLGFLVGDSGAIESHLDNDCKECGAYVPTIDATAQPSHAVECRRGKLEEVQMMLGEELSQQFEATGRQLEAIQKALIRMP